MDFIGPIEQQLRATKLPLIAVTVAAVPYPETPIVLTLHWHAFIREKLAEIDSASAVRFTPVPSSALQLNVRWDDVLDVDRASLDAAWALGAWNVAREEHRACLRPGAPSSEAVECLQAFGALPPSPEGHPTVIAETPDADELLDVAARRGYLKWIFHPVHGGVWQTLADDETLQADGTRDLPCPEDVIAPRLSGAQHTVYQLGKSSRLLT